MTTVLQNKPTMLNQIGGAIHGAIGAVGAVAGAVLGRGGGNNDQGQNDRLQPQGNDGPPSATSSSSNNAPPNPDASVLDPTYVLTNSVSEQLGMNNDNNEISQQKQSEEDHQQVVEVEEQQAPNPLFDTTADRMPYAPGQQQILGDSTVGRLQLPVAENTTRDGTTLVTEETSEASGRGYSSSEESSPFLSSFETSIDDNVGAAADASTLSPITAANSTHSHRASIASPNFELDERSHAETASGLENGELEEPTSVDGTGTSTAVSGVLVGLDHNESSNIVNISTAEEEHFPAEDGDMLKVSDTDGNTTESVDVETDLETTTSTTRSGRNYASTSTIVRSTRNASGSKRKDSQQPTQIDASTKRHKTNDQSHQPSILSTDLTTPVFGVKATHNTTTDDFIVELQIVVDGPYLEASKEDIIILRRMGHTDTLEAVRELALKKGEARSAISSGAKSESDEKTDSANALESTELKCLGPVPMRATRKFCATDSITNMLHDVAPHLYTEELGKVLRSLCDSSDGKIDMKSLCLKVRVRMKQLRFELQKIKKVEGGKHFLNVSPLLRQDAVLDLASKGKLLIVDYFSKRHSKARGHVVGVANGKVYGNDEATGGIFDLHAYAAREWDGIYAARIVVPRPCY